MIPVVALVVQVAAPAPAMQGVVNIFDMLCAQVFPDDARIDAAMASIPDMRPLTPAQVRTYLKDDPGRGWVMDVGSTRIVITIEAPPVHACAVRVSSPSVQIDEAMWRRVVEAAEARAGGGFTPLPPQTLVVGDVRSTVSGDHKFNRDGSAESFYLFRNVVAKPKEGSNPPVELRMVRQIIAAGAR
jgi:hypothetical protein